MRKWSGCLLFVFVAVIVGSVAAAPVELSFWGWLPGTANGDILTRYLDEFHAAYPNIRVKVEKGSSEPQLMVAFAAGAAPDVVQGVGSWATSLGSKGVLLPLDSFIDGPNGLKRDDYVDDLWSFSRFGGKTYQLAADCNERALYVNADAAAAAGINVNQPIRDWNALVDWARKLTRRVSDKVERWGFEMQQENGGNRWHWIWLNEGELISPDGSKALFDHPNTIAALKFAGDIVNTYRVAPVPGAVSGNPRNNFLNNIYGMIFTSSTFITNLESARKSFVTIPGPPGPGKTGYRFSGATSSVLSIVSSSKHPQEAWTFIRWLLYEKGVQFANDRGGIPYLKRGLRNEKFQQQPWAAFATSIMTYAPRNTYIVASADWSPAFDAAWSAVLKGEKSAEVALTQAQEATNARLAELRNK